MKSFVIFSVTLMLLKFIHADQMVYEFGSDSGEVIYSKDGTIGLLKYETTINIPVPDYMTVTYLKVTVNSFSPPKVDYEDASKRIVIKYTWMQLPASYYNIVVKGSNKIKQ